MGIQSRLLLSLNDNGKLWGFISCLSDGGHTIPYVDRLAYQGFAEMAALLLIEKEKAALQQQILFNKKQIAAITKGLEAACDFGVALQGCGHHKCRGSARGGADKRPGRLAGRAARLFHNR
jgi:light-regulated signal transduction histidine kinase (bacteriophytochrome)